MARGCNAYLSIFNDWELLGKSVKSIAPYIDELIVVDGAYKWMESYYRTLDIEPTRSGDDVYDALESCGVPYRVITGTWNHEIEKRIAGFTAASSSRYVYRTDADEVMFFNEEAIERFYSSGLAVAHMDMPLYVAPGWIRARKDAPDRQCFLFDTNKITPENHLLYLWLVLTADKLPNSEAVRQSVFEEPLAFNAHLTHWRSPKTAAFRASFYFLNFVRGYGVPWLPEFRDKPQSDLTVLLSQLPPKSLYGALQWSDIVSGPQIKSDDRFELRRTPLGAVQECLIAPYYETFITERAAKTEELNQYPHNFIIATDNYIDYSRPETYQLASQMGAITLEFSIPIGAARAHMHYVIPSPSGHVISELEYKIDGNRLVIQTPHDVPSKFLARNLEFQVWGQYVSPIQTFKCVV